MEKERNSLHLDLWEMLYKDWQISDGDGTVLDPTTVQHIYTL